MFFKTRITINIFKVKKLLHYIQTYLNKYEDKHILLLRIKKHYII